MAYIIQSALLVLNNSFHTLLVEHETQKLISSKHEQDLNSLRLVVQALQTENIQLKDTIPFILNENKALKDTNTDLMNSMRELSEKLVELSSANAVELEDETHVHEVHVEEQVEEEQVEQEQEQEEQEQQQEEQEQEQEDTEHVEEEQEIQEEEQEPSHVEEHEHIQQAVPLPLETNSLYETQYSLTRNYREQITRVTSGAIVSQIRSVSWQMGRYRPAAIVPQKIIQTLARSNSGPCSISRLSMLVLISKNELKKYIRELKKQGIISDM